MSGLEAAAGVIGIADVSLKSIKGLYDFLQAVHEVPERLAQINNNLSELQARLESLVYLTQADQETRKEVRETGITKAMNDCGNACDQFLRKLKEWFKRGEDSLRGRLKMVWNDAVVQKSQSIIWSTARTLDSAVGILTLRIVMKDISATEKAEQVEKLKKEVEEWKSQAAVEEARISQVLIALEEADDDASEPAREELRSATGILESFKGQCSKTARKLETMKLRQSIQRIYNDKESKVMIGMPSSVVDKVSEQIVSDVATMEKGDAQIGIFAEFQQKG